MFRARRSIIGFAGLSRRTCQHCQLKILQGGSTRELGRKIKKLFRYRLVRNLENRSRIGGREFHIPDCHVWAEIYYLDSPTDYREYLTGNMTREGRAGGQPMILLDDCSPPSFWSLAKTFFVVSIPLLVILLIVISRD